LNPRLTVTEDILYLTPLVRSQALADRVADALREAILAGQLRPGNRLSVPEVARRMGCSRTPVKEALLILERDGLVASRPRFGAEVLRGSESDLADLLDVREALDGMVARLAATRMTPTDKLALGQLIDEHDKALEASDIDRHVALDLAFHRQLREGSGNARLIRALLALEWQIQVLMNSTSKAPGFAGTAVMRDHRAIADAVLRGDGDAAEHAARAHVQRIRRFCSLLAEQPASGTAKKSRLENVG
jgi:DNA-binding GntR family transcriptional regulator